MPSLSLQVGESPGFNFLILTEVTSLWTVLLFLMLLCLGLCTSTMLMLGTIIPLQDTFPFCRRQPRGLLGTSTYGPALPLLSPPSANP